MQIDIVCNTDDETLFKNVYQNSRRDIEWIEQVDAHDGHAILVGGGPSLKESIEVIRWRKSLGQKIFALNGAARFLSGYGIWSDYLVVLDARASNEEFTKASAGQYLLASQCHPSLFKNNYYTKLWHPKIDGIEDQLPDKRESLTLVGGGTSVGLSTMCLAYTMGYRKIHLFGYDSSHSETSHAYTQDMNSSEPTCKVTVFGKTFKTSLTMAKQAEFFPTLCNNLIDRGCIITVDGEGLLPFITRELSKQQTELFSEQDKYQRMWSLPEYRTFSPGEECVETFLNVSMAVPGDTVIDYGCGTGRAAMLLNKAELDVTALDFTDNCLDEKSKSIKFINHDLTQPLGISSRFGFCTDVMEHIPPKDVEKVVQNIMESSQEVFFQISLVDDCCGELIGQQLHLSIHPVYWWRDLFFGLGYSITWSREKQNAALFYVVNP